MVPSTGADAADEYATCAGAVVVIGMTSAALAAPPLLVVEYGGIAAADGFRFQVSGVGSH